MILNFLFGFSLSVLSFSLMEISELRKSERIGPGLQHVARNLFSEDLLPIGKFKGFYFRIFSEFSNIPTWGPNKTRTKILWLSGSSGHFLSGFGTGPALEIQIVGKFPLKSKIERPQLKYLVRIRPFFSLTPVWISHIVPASHQPKTWQRVAQKRSTLFRRTKPRERKKIDDFLECSPQSSFWLACPGSHAKHLQESWKHKQMDEGNFHEFSEFSLSFVGNFGRSSAVSQSEIFRWCGFRKQCVHLLIFWGF
jgi:hypothetical protein